MYTRVKYNVLFSTDNGKLYRKLTKVLSVGCTVPYRDNSTKNRWGEDRYVNRVCKSYKKQRYQRRIVP